MVAPDFISGRFDDRSAWSKYKYYFVIPDTHSVIPDLIEDLLPSGGAGKAAAPHAPRAGWRGKEPILDYYKRDLMYSLRFSSSQ